MRRKEREVKGEWHYMSVLFCEGFLVTVAM